jgi:nucleoside-diphosphate-sugar epimerase
VEPVINASNDISNGCIRTSWFSFIASSLFKLDNQLKHCIEIPYPIEIANTSEGVEWVKGDILDVVALEESMDQVDQVYHCAAVVSFNPSKKGAMQHTNIEGTANVVNACINRGVKTIALCEFRCGIRKN